MGYVRQSGRQVKCINNNSEIGNNMTNHCNNHDNGHCNLPYEPQLVRNERPKGLELNCGSQTQINTLCNSNINSNVHFQSGLGLTQPQY